MNRLVQCAYRIQKRLWKLLRPRTRGVKAMLFNGEGEILLIRNTYGATHLFVLPGGGIRPWEKPLSAVQREIHEELGCHFTGLFEVSTHLSCGEGKRDRVHLFEATIDQIPRADGIEVAEARFFGLDALPTSISPATKRRLEERSGARDADGSW